MLQTTRSGGWLIGLAIAGLVVLMALAARPPDRQRAIQKMQTQIASIRGLPFKHDVVLQEQSQADFEKHAEAQFQQLSEPGHEAVARTLGLLASDETLDVDAFRKGLRKPGATARYEPEAGRVFFVPATQVQPAAERDIMYVRELYRALLDQHFDLKTYLGEREGGLNADEQLARQMVVEGEALYATILWGVKKETGRIPEHLPLQSVMEPTLDPRGLMEMHDDPRMRKVMGGKRTPARSDSGMPTYVLQMGEDLQRKGMLFADAVRKRGWDETTRLYTTSPPVSTEQILHPRKWFQGERPVKIQWPAFESNAAFADWELLEQGVLGELMMRALFRVHRLSPMMGSNPDGWNGDRYAVLKRRDSGDTLLLFYTAWDTERDAASFAGTYRVLLKEKYRDAATPVRLLEEGRRVVIVEGGEESSLDAFMAFARSAQEIEESVAVEQ